MTVNEVIEEVLKDEIFYINSGGGVTLSGGEPLMQADFSAAVLKECKQKGVHTAVETAGHLAWSLIEKVIPYTDLFLYDIKHMDPIIHDEHIGVNNRLILANIEKLSKTAKEIIVRIPVVPGFNASTPEVGAIARFTADLGIRELHLLPYHHFGKGKYRLLGREYLCQVKNELQNNDLAEFKEAAASAGLKVKIGG